MSISKLIYRAGILARNKKVFTNLDFLLKSQNWSTEELKAYQTDKLKTLLENAYRNSPFYRKKFDDAGLDIKSVKNLSDLASVPFLTKEEVLSNAKDIQINVTDEKMFYSETSGSTGKPLVFYRNLDWDAWHRASIFRGYSWYGVSPWDKNGYLWGYNLAFKRRMKTRFLDFLQNRFRLFSYRDEEIDLFAKKLAGADFLSGYSSMIYEVAKRINSLPVKPELKLKMLKGTSEKIYDSYQEEAIKAFGRKIISEYGAAEAGIIAFECPSGNMHVNMETAIVEEIDGEIAVTNLASRSFPIIRYRLGDYIKLDESTVCACGRKHPIIKEVLGRVGKLIYGFKRKYPSLTLYYVFKNLAMEKNIVFNYQAVQKTKGFLNVKIESVPNEVEAKLLDKEFKKYFEDDLKVTMETGVALKSTTKKKADFISEI